MRANRLLLFLFCMLLGSCVDRFKLPNSHDSGYDLVCYGQITNNYGIQKIELSYSASLADSDVLPCTNAHVFVEVNEERPIEFFEWGAPGEYFMWLDEESLTVGNTFKLIIETTDGEVYESEMETMLPQPAIQQITIKQEKKKVLSKGQMQELDGLMFYTDASSNDSNTKYFRLELEETWKIISPLTGVLFDGWHDHLIPADSAYICYKSELVSDVVTISMEDYLEQSIKQFPTYFVHNQSEKLNYEYGLNVKMMAVSYNSYKFWNDLELLHQGSGGIFEVQPYSAQGNIKCISDPTRKAIGVFEVVSYTEKGEHVFNEYGFWYDEYESCSLEELHNGKRDIDPARLPAYIYYKPIPGQMNPLPCIVPGPCVDCRLRGGIPQKPEYWN